MKQELAPGNRSPLSHRSHAPGAVRSESRRVFRALLGIHGPRPLLGSDREQSWFRSGRQLFFSNPAAATRMTWDSLSSADHAMRLRPKGRIGLVQGVGGADEYLVAAEAGDPSMAARTLLTSPTATVQRCFRCSASGSCHCNAGRLQRARERSILMRLPTHRGGSVMDRPKHRRLILPGLRAPRRRQHCCCSAASGRQHPIRFPPLPHVNRGSLSSRSLTRSNHHHRSSCAER